MNDRDTLYRLIMLMRDYLHVDGVSDYGNRIAVMRALGGCLEVQPQTIDTWLAGRKIPAGVGLYLKIVIKQMENIE